MHADSTLDIDLAAIGRNAARFRRALGHRRDICGVVKADAYGLGAHAIAPVLEQAGWNLLAVHRIDEALALLDVVEVPLLVLGPVKHLSPMHPLASAAITGRVHLTIQDRGSFDDACRLAQSMGRPVGVHLEIDTGMGRGVSLQEGPRLLRRLLAEPRLVAKGIMTHFTAASNAQLTRDQFEAFDRAMLTVRRRLPKSCPRHCAATTATIEDESLWCDMVRIGLGWVGHALGVQSPCIGGEALEGAVTWSSRIAWVRDVPAGTSLGYGSTFTCHRDSRIAMVPVGYADGLGPSATGCMLKLLGVEGQPQSEAPIVGTVAMDQVLLDVTDTPAMAPGMRVEVFDGQSLGALSSKMGLQPHHLLTAIGPRVHRRLRGQTGALPRQAAAS
ncbi:MAG: alanine racemase [Phycisphaerales bacterium]|nr:alanine racemase [Phycisphaerales bacterium]